MQVDRVVGDLAEEIRLPVPLQTLRVEPVEQALEDRERNRPGKVHRGRRERADRLEDVAGLGGVARVAPHDHAHLLQVVLLREHRYGRHGDEAEPAVEILRGVHDEVAPEAEDLPPLAERPEDRPAVDGADRIAAEQERGHDPEVATAAAQGPEEVGVLARARGDEAAVGQDQVRLEEVVDREAVTARQVADSAAQREAADAGGGDEPVGTASPKGCVA